VSKPRATCLYCSKFRSDRNFVPEAPDHCGGVDKRYNRISYSRRRGAVFRTCYRFL